MIKEILVSVKCLLCGAPVKYPEGTYTFRCTYCGSVLRIKKKGIDLKYIIPCRLDHEEVKKIAYNYLNKSTDSKRKTSCVTRINNIYKPFWYFKGILYYNFVDKLKNDTLARSWYLSLQANTDFLHSLNSLSVRTEVLTINPFDIGIISEDDLILPISVKKDDFLKSIKYITKMNFQLEIQKALYEELNIIGGRYFIIYYPIVYAICTGINERHTILIDGINKEILNDEPNEISISSEKEKKPNPESITLLSHRCKNCGYDLVSGDFEVIFYCQNCFRLWLLKEGEYQAIDKEVICAEGFDNPLFVPFWRFEVSISSESSNLEIKDIETLSGFMKMGRYLQRSQDPKRAIRIYCPALISKNARALLKLATRINIHQMGLPIERPEYYPSQKALNASLLDNEAEQMLKVIVFAMIGRTDALALKFYEDFKIDIRQKSLILYPFQDMGDFLLDKFHEYNFPKKSLEIRMFSSASFQAL